MEGYKQNLPPEEVIDDGLGLLIRNKRLYHGTGVDGLQGLRPAEETTVGEGVYFTSLQSDALGYAERRSKRSEDSTPTVYAADVENLRLLDLRSKANVLKVLQNFKPLLVAERKKKDLPWSYEAALDAVIEAINSENIENLKQITFTHGKLFTDYVASLGYDGLIAIEGGEGEDVGTHDTYLVFDSGKIKGLTNVRVHQDSNLD